MISTIKVAPFLCHLYDSLWILSNHLHTPKSHASGCFILRHFSNIFRLHSNHKIMISSIFFASNHLILALSGSNHFMNRVFFPERLWVELQLFFPCKKNLKVVDVLSGLILSQTSHFISALRTSKFLSCQTSPALLWLNNTKEPALHCQ